jgi:hypothetical protein
MGNDDYRCFSNFLRGASKNQKRFLDVPIINRIYLSALSNAELLSVAYDISPDFPFPPMEDSAGTPAGTGSWRRIAEVINRNLLINEILDSLADVDRRETPRIRLYREVEAETDDSRSEDDEPDKAAEPVTEPIKAGGTETDDQTEEEQYRQIAKLIRVKLPARYNISYIRTLIRDPLWVYVYWEIKHSERALMEAYENFLGYCLKVERIDGLADDAWFININNEDDARYIDFSHLTNRNNDRFSVSVCAILGDTGAREHRTLFASLPFSLPRILKNPIQPKKEDPSPSCRIAQFAKLSGLFDMPLLRERDKSI